MERSREVVANVAIVKATYTKQAEEAKTSIHYIANRPGKDNQHTTQTLFGIDRTMDRKEAYRMIDEAKQGSIFFRFVISPDPTQEDTDKDLYLREITEKTMQTLEERLGKQVSWVAAIHNDHAPHRHVHIVSIVSGRLQAQDFQAMRQTATEEGVAQRQELDARQEMQ